MLRSRFQDEGDATCQGRQPLSCKATSPPFGDLGTSHISTAARIPVSSMAESMSRLYEGHTARAPITDILPGSVNIGCPCRHEVANERLKAHQRMRRSESSSCMPPSNPPGELASTSSHCPSRAEPTETMTRFMEALTCTKAILLVRGTAVEAPPWATSSLGCTRVPMCSNRGTVGLTGGKPWIRGRSSHQCCHPLVSATERLRTRAPNL